MVAVLRARAFPRLLFLFLVALSSLWSLGRAASNVTVDDEYGDEVTKAKPTYSPTDGWHFGPDCSGCLIKPDAYDAYDNTWHDSTRRPGNGSFTIEIDFTGFAVYVYFILSGYVYGGALTTNVSFVLDGNVDGSFSYNPGYNPNFMYNYLVYSNANLENISHTLIIESRADVDQSLVLFDRLVYSTGDPNSPPESSSTWMPVTTDPASAQTTSAASEDAGYALPTLSASASDTASSSRADAQVSTTESSSSSQSAVVGGAVGGGIGLVAISVASFFCWRRRRRRPTPVGSPASSKSLLWRRGKGLTTTTTTTTRRQSIDPEGGTGVVLVQQNGNVLVDTRQIVTGSASVAVAPALSSVSGSTSVRKPPNPDVELSPRARDAFRRDETDEKLERIVRPSAVRAPAHMPIRTRSTDRHRDYSTPASATFPTTTTMPTTWQLTSRGGPNTGTGSGTNGSGDRALLNRIAVLQAEVELLRERQSTISEPPPSYHGGGS